MPAGGMRRSVRRAAPACGLREGAPPMRLGAAMQQVVVSRVRRFLRLHDAWYGFEYAVLFAAIAGLLVLSASLYTRETMRLMRELHCALAPSCTVRIEISTRPPPLPGEPAAEPAVSQTVAFPIQEPETP